MRAAVICPNLRFKQHCQMLKRVVSPHAAHAGHQVRGGVEMLIIDRFEGDFAVVEADDTFINIPSAELPDNAKEGDVLRLVIDIDATDERKKRIRDLMGGLRW